MADLPTPVKQLLERSFGARLSSQQMSNLEDLVSESALLTTQLSTFAVNGQIIFGSPPPGMGDVAVFNPSFESKPTIVITISNHKSNTLIQQNPFFEPGAQLSNGVYDTVVGNIVGILSHEIGHFMNSVDSFESMIGANPLFKLYPPSTPV